MAFSKNIATYPASIVKLFEIGTLATQDYKVPCESSKEAHKVRMLLNGVSYAIRQTQDHPLLPHCGKKQLTISRNNEVVFRMPENSPLKAFGDQLLAKAEQANKGA